MLSSFSSLPPADLPLDNPLWQFSLSLWRMPDVQEASLQCQNEYGMRVNQILFGLWLAQGHRQLDKNLLSKESQWQHWHQQVVAPLRDLRKWLPDDQHACWQNFRHQLQQSELMAEQIDQALLYRLSNKMPAASSHLGAGQVAATNLATLLIDVPTSQQHNCLSLLARIARRAFPDTTINVWKDWIIKALS